MIASRSRPSWPKGDRTLLVGDLKVTFNRTVRVEDVPDKVNSLPPGTGFFEIFRVDDYPRSPQNWKRGVGAKFVVMYLHEAMWMGLKASYSNPVAVMIGAGMVNAITGKELTAEMIGNPQNYVVVPNQPWLDGFKSAQSDKVYQFVASELGEGETAEEQILKTKTFGGIQFATFNLIHPLPPPPPQQFMRRGIMACTAKSASMGLGAGGAIEQKVYPDPHLCGRDVRDVWKPECEKSYVYILNAEVCEQVMGAVAPASPITEEWCNKNNYPWWYALHDSHMGDVKGGSANDQLKHVGKKPIKKKKSKKDPW